MTNWPVLLTRRVWAASQTTPHLKSLLSPTWGSLTLAVVVTAALAVPAGISSGFLQWRPLRRGSDIAVALSIVALRALVEELVFRGAALPHPAVDGKGAMSWEAFSQAAALPLVAFVGSHFLTTRRAPGEVARDPFFLGLITLLGIACSAVYYLSGGSLAAALMTHFLPTAAYATLLGGYAKLNGTTAVRKAAAHVASTVAEKVGPAADSAADAAKHAAAQAAAAATDAAKRAGDVASEAAARAYDAATDAAASAPGAAKRAAATASEAAARAYDTAAEYVGPAAQSAMDSAKRAAASATEAAMHPADTAGGRARRLSGSASDAAARTSHTTTDAAVRAYGAAADAATRAYGAAAETAKHAVDTAKRAAASAGDSLGAAAPHAAEALRDLKHAMGPKIDLGGAKAAEPAGAKDYTTTVGF